MIYESLKQKTLERHSGLSFYRNSIGSSNNFIAKLIVGIFTIYQPRVCSRWWGFQVWPLGNKQTLQNSTVFQMSDTTDRTSGTESDRRSGKSPSVLQYRYR